MALVQASKHFLEGSCVWILSQDLSGYFLSFKPVLNATAPVLGSNLKPTVFAVLNVLYFLGHSDGLAKSRGTFARTFGEKVHWATFKGRQLPSYKWN